MIIGYLQTENGIQAIAINKANSEKVKEAIWLDLLSPTRREEKLVEEILNLDVPTKKEMAEIELSSRLYIEDEGIFMTATMVVKSESPQPKADPVTFILLPTKLITVRYVEPHAFELFIARLLRRNKKEYTPERMLIGLFESTVDRLADILEHVSHEFDQISQTIFHQHSEDKEADHRINYKELLQHIGVNGDLGTKARESLVSFSRVLSFLQQETEFDTQLKARIRTISKDITALSDYAGFISTKVNFLLDATLGLVSIDQNNIIKIFSVAAVVFLPPTLIASIYGMNFTHMPELAWRIGYPIAIGMMMLSAWLPYTYFKRQKWL